MTGCIAQKAGYLSTEDLRIVGWYGITGFYDLHDLSKGTRGWSFTRPSGSSSPTVFVKGHGLSLESHAQRMREIHRQGLNEGV